MPPPPPPRPAAPKPAAPVAPAAVAKPVAAAPVAAAAAPATTVNRVVKFGGSEVPVPTEIGGINLDWAKATVTSAFEAVPLKDFGTAFDNLDLQTIPNTAEGKRAYKLCKALDTFSRLLFKAERKARVPGSIGGRARTTLLELVKLVGVDVIIAKVGAEKFASYSFTEAELAA